MARASTARRSPTLRSTIAFMRNVRAESAVLTLHISEGVITTPDIALSMPADPRLISRRRRFSATTWAAWRSRSSEDRAAELDGSVVDMDMDHLPAPALPGEFASECPCGCVHRRRHAASAAGSASAHGAQQVGACDDPTSLPFSTTGAA